MLHPAAPGPDGVTFGTIKILAQDFTSNLLDMVKASLENAWIPSIWKTAKITVFTRM